MLDYDHAYAESREWVSTEDDARIPVSIVHDLDGLGLLVGYGAYEMPSDPYFSIARFLACSIVGWWYAVARPRRRRDGTRLV